MAEQQFEKQNLTINVSPISLLLLMQTIVNNEEFESFMNFLNTQFSIFLKISITNNHKTIEENGTK